VVPEDILLKVHDLVKAKKVQETRQQKKSFEPLKTSMYLHIYNTLLSVCTSIYIILYSLYVPSYNTLLSVCTSI